MSNPTPMNDAGTTNLGAEAEASSAETDLRARNLEVFRQHYPHVYAVLHNYTPASTLVELDNGEYDVELGGTYLYDGQGAATFARTQLDKYWGKPHRVTLNRPEYVNQESAVGWVLNDAFDAAKEEEIEFAPSPVSADSYFVVVFGIGLAPHIEELAEKTNCRCLVLCEPNPEFLYHSLSIFDWAGLIDSFSAQSKKIRFAITNDPVQLNHMVRGTIRNVNPCSMDGMHIYFHFSNAILTNAAIGFQKDLAVTMMGLGFFEDELAMISQSYRNLVGGKARIMTDKHKRVDMPVIIVGGGPSLDQNIDVIQAMKDKAVVIACGTSMEPLLKHGIIPDFNILLERSELLLKAHEEAAAMFDLSKTVLVSSTTIYPGIGEKFGDVIYFFRAGLSSYPMFSTDPSQALPRCDPIVANGALAFAQTAGFRNFYFFGVDCGAKDERKHHSKHSWYYDNRMSDYLLKFRDRVPGNFGGTVLSNEILMWSRDGLQNAILMLSAGRKYYNCSDGAQITGAMPKIASTISIPDSPRPKADIVREIVERFPHYTQVEFDKAWERGNLLGRIPEVAEALLDAVEKHESLHDFSYLDDANTFLKPAHNDDVTAMLYRGSVWLALIAFEHFYRRIEDPEKAKRFEDLFRTNYRAGMETMRDEALRVFSDLVDTYGPKSTAGGDA